METADTICAVSTPPGEGGIAIIRMSGRLAHTILNTIFIPKKKQEEFLSRKFYLGRIINSDNHRIIDEVFAVFMKAPDTYTKEDIAEVYSHGGYAAKKNILNIMMQNGARLAEPGEFTKRAFLNGRIDLTQAESVLDIIQSETDEELQNAIEHLSGSLSEKITFIKENIKKVLAETEALIDFPEEEIDVDEKEIFSTLKQTRQDIKKLLNSYYEGKAIKQGFEVLILGKPNVGKSSLLNALLLKERAIVTPIPGTTRDLIEDIIHIKGVKVRVVDTAGLRIPMDAVEEAGIEKVRQKIPKTDLIIWILDSSGQYTNEDEDIYKNIATKRKIVALNKIDLPGNIDTTALQSKDLQWLKVSALKDMGLEQLKGEIYRILMEKGAKGGGELITNERHRDALKKSSEALKEAISVMKTNGPLEITAFELRQSLFRLGEITGETCPDDILHDIFERFCIGK
jgi:tRNA modification GTPase